MAQLKRIWAGAARLLGQTWETLATLAAVLSLLYHGWRVTRNWKAHRRNLERLQRAALKVKRGKILGRPVEIQTGGKGSDSETD